MHHLYEFLKRGIFPWMWDFENYTGSPDKDWMRKNQMFYPEDLQNILQIDKYVRDSKSNK